MTFLFIPQLLDFRYMSPEIIDILLSLAQNSPWLLLSLFLIYGIHKVCVVVYARLFDKDEGLITLVIKDHRRLISSLENSNSKLSDLLQAMKLDLEQTRDEILAVKHDVKEVSTNLDGLKREVDVISHDVSKLRKQ